MKLSVSAPAHRRMRPSTEDIAPRSVNIAARRRPRVFVLRAALTIAIGTRRATPAWQARLPGRRNALEGRWTRFSTELAVNYRLTTKLPVYVAIGDPGDPSGRDSVS